MNYTTLLQQIQDYCEDDSAEFIAEIPQIITNAEHRIFRDVSELPAFRTSATGTFVAGTRTFAQPADLRTTRALAITVSGEVVFLEKRIDTYILDYSPTTTQSQPKFYAEVNETNYILGPVPDQNYAYEVYYRREPSGLSVSNLNTEVGDNHEDLLMFACLAYGEEFLQNDVEQAKWEGEYGKVKEATNLEVRRRYQTEYGVTS